MARPQWSIIVTTYKRPERLRGTLAKIAEAITAVDAEVLIADDDPEGSASPVAAEYPRFGYRRNEANLGTVGNINDGVIRSEGLLIHWCADDDWPEPGFYSAMWDAWLAHGPDLLHCGYRNHRDGVAHDMPLLAPSSGPLNPAAYTARLMFGNPTHMAATAFSRSLWSRCGGFDPAYPYLHDWHFLLQAGALSRPYFVAERLANYSEHAGSMTRSDGAADAKQAEWAAMMPALLEFYAATTPKGVGW